MRPSVLTMFQSGSLHFTYLKLLPTCSSRDMPLLVIWVLPMPFLSSFTTVAEISCIAFADNPLMFA